MAALLAAAVLTQDLIGQPRRRDPSGFEFKDGGRSWILVRAPPLILLAAGQMVEWIGLRRSVTLAAVSVACRSVGMMTIADSAAAYSP